MRRKIIDLVSLLSITTVAYTTAHADMLIRSPCMSGNKMRASIIARDHSLQNKISVIVKTIMPNGQCVYSDNFIQIKEHDYAMVCHKLQRVVRENIPQARVKCEGYPFFDISMTYDADDVML